MTPEDAHPRARYTDASGRMVWEREQELPVQALEEALRALGHGPLPPDIDDPQMLRLWLLGLLMGTVAEQAMHVPGTREGMVWLARGAAALHPGGSADETQRAAVEICEWVMSTARWVDMWASGTGDLDTSDQMQAVLGYMAQGMMTVGMLGLKAVMDPNPYGPHSSDVRMLDWLEESQQLARLYWPQAAREYDERPPADQQVPVR